MPKASSRSIVITSPYRAGRDAAKRSPNETKAFILPSVDAANHLLDRPAKARQTCGRAVSAVTVRSVAVDDEHRVGRVSGQISLVDFSVRQTDGTGYVAFPE